MQGGLFRASNSARARSSENQFHRQLNIPRIVLLTGDAAVICACRVRIRTAEPDAVESIDHLKPKLETDALTINIGVLHEGHVPVVYVRVPQIVPHERNATG